MPQKGLQRKLGLFPATNIVIANMIGAGIFTTSGLLMGNLNNPVLMVSLWIAGGIIALCGALSYGTLGSVMPEAGGEYYFLSRMFHPMAGFLSGWVSFIVGFSAPIAASAIGFSEYLIRAFPQLSSWTQNYAGIQEEWIMKFFAILIILLFTLLHSTGLELGAKIQNLLTILKVVLILGLIVAGILSNQGDFSHFRMNGISTGSKIQPEAIGLSLMWIMFAYSGWNASTYIGSEIKNPAKNLPSSLLIGTGTVIVLYFLLNVLFVYAIPPEDMEGVISVGGLAMSNLIGPTAGSFFSLLISFALFSSLSAFIIIGPRVYYKMAEDGLFFKFLAKVHPKFKVPALSILVQGGIAIIFVLTGTFEQILTYMGFSLGIFPLLTIAGLIKIKIKNKINIKTCCFPFPQIIYMLAGILILILAFMERPTESTIAMATVIIGVPVYYFFSTQKKRKEDSMQP